MDAWMTSSAWIHSSNNTTSWFVFCEAVYPIRNAGTAVMRKPGKVNGIELQEAIDGSRVHQVQGHKF
jgi:hypothetical protein